MKVFKTYYQLTKPGIIYGNVLNALAGFLLASRWHFSASLLLGTLGGIALVIASACVFNNYLDRGIDAKMARTKKRALVVGSVSPAQSLLYATGLGVLGFLVLAHYTNVLTVKLGLLAIFTYVVLYGITKRRSVHGTVVGSIAGALPPVAAYTAVTNRLDTGAWLIFLIYTLWQMPHFYAIAIYRLKEYQAAGVPVLTVKKSILAAKWQIVLYIVTFALATVGLTVFDYTGYIFAVILSAVNLYWLIKAWQGFSTKNDNAWGRNMFGFSLLVVLVLAVMLAFGPILP